MAKMSTRDAIANAFAPYSKEFQRRAAQAEDAKKRAQERAKKNTKMQLFDSEYPYSERFMKNLKKIRRK